MDSFVYNDPDSNPHSVCSSDSDCSNPEELPQQTPMTRKWSLPPANPLLPKSMFDYEPVRLGGKSAFMSVQST